MKLNELKHIAPILANIQEKGTGFKQPINYFNEIESVVISQLQINTTSRLETGIPKDYFENFEDQLFKRMALEKKTQVVSLKKYWISTVIAASLLLLVSIYNPLKDNTYLKNTEIEAWIEEENMELYSYEIADLYNLEIENLSFNETIETEDLEDYLLEEMNESTFYN